MLTKCCKNWRYEPAVQFLYLFVHIQQCVLSVDQSGVIQGVIKYQLSCGPNCRLAPMSPRSQRQLCVHLSLTNILIVMGKCTN